MKDQAEDDGRFQAVINGLFEGWEQIEFGDPQTKALPRDLGGAVGPRTLMDVQGAANPRDQLVHELLYLKVKTDHIFRPGIDSLKLE